MKHATTSKTICALITGLLIASASALAQVAPPTPASVAPNYSSGRDSSYAMPKATGPNLYLEGGLAYMNAKPGNSSGADFWGINTAFGWRINKNNKIQAELGVLMSSEDHGRGIKEEDTALMLLASYSYCIPLNSDGNWELRLTPAAGFTSINLKLKRRGYGSDDDTDTAFAFGGGMGITYHISDRFYMDFGYRYLRVGSTEYRVFNIEDELDDMNTHTASVSFGWKF
ncbi:opacity protein-like surface antigen [Ereboglobus sp. PH5-5]|uniref:porin family protein n=1 Tax=unclassified Ereboglobus TaxID=2626932 RepID=UPI002405031A|nr:MULTISPECIES: porin family protein [unclassified Ereboglobus]MDF9828266.1 opacity protein-like surface antigen [Ereboglobus sp. PH5-10]MDF9833330.1 opacity protein-like surface antigen [Ereboglobus sp. PH5-5]